MLIQYKSFSPLFGLCIYLCHLITRLPKGIKKDLLEAASDSYNSRSTALTRDINEELHQMAVKIVPFVSLNERIRDAHDWSLRKSRGLLRTCAMKL